MTPSPHPDPKAMEAARKAITQSSICANNEHETHGGALCRTCIAAALEDHARAAVEKERRACASLAEEGCFDIGGTAIELAGVGQRTRNAIAAGIRARGQRTTGGDDAI